MKIRVYYEDTDAGGIVYHTNYIKYCERARSEAFFSRGMEPLGDNSSGFIVTSLNADFHAPAKLGDMLEVKSEIETLKKSYVILKQVVYKDETKLFSMTIKVAYISNGRISKIPDDFISLLESI